MVDHQENASPSACLPYSLGWPSCLFDSHCSGTGILDCWLKVCLIYFLHGKKEAHKQTRKQRNKERQRDREKEKRKRKKIRKRKRKTKRKKQRKKERKKERNKDRKNVTQTITITIKPIVETEHCRNAWCGNTVRERMVLDRAVWKHMVQKNYGAETHNVET